MRRTLRTSAPIDLQQTLGPLRVGHHDPTIDLSPPEVWRATRPPEGPATVHLRTGQGVVEVEAWGRRLVEATREPASSEAVQVAPGL